MNKSTAFTRLIICIVFLLVLIVLHIIPLPILELLMLYIMVFRPRWFKDLIDSIYKE